MGLSGIPSEVISVIIGALLGGGFTFFGRWLTAQRKDQRHEERLSKLEDQIGVQQRQLEAQTTRELLLRADKVSVTGVNEHSTVIKFRLVNASHVPIKVESLSVGLVDSDRARLVLGPTDYSKKPEEQWPICLADHGDIELVAQIDQETLTERLPVEDEEAAEYQALAIDTLGKTYESESFTATSLVEELARTPLHAEESDLETALSDSEN